MTEINPTAASKRLIHVACWALTDQMGFPTYPLTIDIPTRPYANPALGFPGSANPVALLRWIADTVERDGLTEINLTIGEPFTLDHLKPKEG